MIRLSYLFFLPFKRGKKILINLPTLFNRITQNTVVQFGQFALIVNSLESRYLSLMKKKEKYPTPYINLLMGK